ncbi:MmpS family transport accessory protein [Leucobacter sp. gxy201]|uniref:MmpS family transport accessory protein n=1 Tax=Leucobacter sp. gxy201 TaxID=2957200 RepID=UPI003DA0ABF3
MKKTITALALSAMIALGLAACSNGAAPAEPAPEPAQTEETPAPAEQEKQSTVLYEVTSDAATASSITYMTLDDGGTGQEMATDAAVPFSKEISVTQGGTFNPQMFTLSAMASQDATTITCKITHDGEVIAEQTSTGPLSMVTCSKM